MKKLFVFTFILLFSFTLNAQSIGSKVSFTAVDGKYYTGSVTEVHGDKYKIKYDGFDFEAWLGSDQFKVVNTNTYGSTTHTNQEYNAASQNQQSNDASQKLRAIFDFGKERGWAAAFQENKYNQYVSPLPAKDKITLLNFLLQAKTSSAQFFVFKSWLTGERNDVLQKFIGQLNNHSESDQQEKCLVTTHRSIIQQWEFSCSVTTVQTFLADLSPRYAWEIKQINNFDAAANDPNHPMAQQQKILMEKYGGVTSPRGDFSGKPIGITEALNDYVGPILGVHFTYEFITEPLQAVLGKIRNQIDRGIDVPLNIKFVGTEARHFILVMKYKYIQGSYQYLIYDPWDGACDYVTESNILQGSLYPLLNQWKVSVDYYYPTY